jgi:hypothetical protein
VRGVRLADLLRQARGGLVHVPQLLVRGCVWGGGGAVGGGRCAQVRGRERRR